MQEEKNRKTYDNLAAIDILHQVSAMYSGTKHPHDYGTGGAYTSTETHLLKCIADHPGITVTELAYNYAKTKGAISQVIKGLIQKGLIEQRPDDGRNNRILLYSTPQGDALNAAHIAYDEEHAGETLNFVREQFTQQEIDIAFSVLECWLVNRRFVHQHRREQRRRKE